MAQPSANAVHVTSAALVGDGSVTWTFDTAIATHPSSGGGLVAAGNDATDYTAATTFTVTCAYGGDVNPGDPWQVIPPTTGLTFVGGASLIAQSGTIS